ncbi:Cytochrome P450 107B1 [Falsiruegeria litorea R37]|uniref:Cytochrome P450 107B1 n=1 Tax=Falsiruegeria litorea R37 TaxID=1200284 RepID=A0A1Y5TTK9_9RHOB|nr:cytochrome P450 [Falsiruegeria litorea]SLN72198.1 Cytochrome P450 107B1 [Falsiruegeria litorea R37]
MKQEKSDVQDVGPETEFGVRARALFRDMTLSAQKITRATDYDAFLDDPYGAYSKLRATNPAYWSPGRNAWLVTSYEDITDIERSSAISFSERCQSRFALLSQRRRALIPTVCQYLPRHLGHLDADDHSQLRPLIDVALSPSRVRRFEPMIRRIVAAQIDALSSRSELDLVEDLFVPLPLSIMIDVLGLDAADAPQLDAWSRRILGPFDFEAAPDVVLCEKEAATAGMASKFREALKTQKADGVLWALGNAAAEANIPEDDAICIAIQILTGAYESLRHAVALGLHAALGNPAWTAANTQGDGALSDAAIDELLRFDSVVQRVTRTASQTIECQSAVIARNERIFLVTGAGNRDPACFNAPDTLSTNRPPQPHLAFGIGRHYCPGARLARMVMRIVLSRLLAADPPFVIDPNDAIFLRSEANRGVQAWPVRGRVARQGGL